MKSQQVGELTGRLKMYENEVESNKSQLESAQDQLSRLSERHSERTMQTQQLEVSAEWTQQCPC